MTEKIDYAFSIISPWAYLGHSLLVKIAQDNGYSINYYPVNLLELFGETGGVPLAQRHEKRQAYRLTELQRWRAYRQVPLNLHPEFWPFNPSLADRTVIAIIKQNHDPAEFIEKSMRAVWYENKDLSQTAIIKEIAIECQLPAEDCLNLAESDETHAAYQANNQHALENGCFGSPTYWLKGEIFHGQDRLEHLQEMIESGREAYTT